MQQQQQNAMEDTAAFPRDQAEAFEMIELRFITSMRPEEFASNERVFTQLEQAWWLYEDEICDKCDHIPHLRKFELFARQFIQWSSAFSPAAKRNFDENYRQYREYQYRIPVRGAALLSPDLKQVLLVSGIKHNSAWGFPKGKINQMEDPVECALREVREETGFDALKYFQGKRDYDWMRWSSHHPTEARDMHLLIIPNVPMDFAFKPEVRKEIGEIKWFPLADLPKHDKDGVQLDGKRAKLWSVSGFLPQLNKWIAAQKQAGGLDGVASTPSKAEVKQIMKRKQNKTVVVQQLATPNTSTMLLDTPVRILKSEDEGKFFINRARLHRAMFQVLHAEG